MFFLELVSVHFLKLGWLVASIVIFLFLFLLDFFLFRWAASTFSGGFLLISQSLLLSCLLDHVFEGDTVSLIAVFLLLRDERPLFALLVEATARESLRIPPIVIEHGPIVQVLE